MAANMRIFMQQDILQLIISIFPVRQQDFWVEYAEAAGGFYISSLDYFYAPVAAALIGMFLI